MEEVRRGKGSGRNYVGTTCLFMRDWDLREREREISLIFTFFLMSSLVSNLLRSGKSAIFGTEFEPSRYEKVDWRIAGDGRYDDFTHSSHVMIYAKTDSAFEGHEKKALILVSVDDLEKA